MFDAAIASIDAAIASYAQALADDAAACDADRTAEFTYKAPDGELIDRDSWRSTVADIIARLRQERAELVALDNRLTPFRVRTRVF